MPLGALWHDYIDSISNDRNHSIRSRGERRVIHLRGNDVRICTLRHESLSHRGDYAIPRCY